MRRAFLVYVDLDSVPGSFDTPFSAFLIMREIFKQHFSQYDPNMILGSIKPATGDARRRVSFILFVDLDSTPGPFYSQESAQNIIRVILRNRIEHYNPMVSLAPANYQPEAILESV